MRFPKWLNPFSWFSRSETTVMTGTDSTPSAPDTPRTGGRSYWELLGGGSNTALAIATVYRCVNLLCDSVAVLPCQFMRQKEGRFVVDTNSRLHYLLNVQPDTAFSAFDFWRQVVQRLLMEGNAFPFTIPRPWRLTVWRCAVVVLSAMTPTTTPTQ